MPAGKAITFEANEYPELSGLENGAPIELKVMAHIETEDGESGSIVFDEVEISTENQADRALSSQVKQSYQPQMVGKSARGTGDDF